MDYNFNVTLMEGMHVLEIYGAEGCCDGQTSWAFAVDNSEWLDFTTENLNMFRYQIIIEPPPTLCDSMTGWERSCPSSSGWHAGTDENGEFEEMDICTVLLSGYGNNCDAYCAE